MEDNLFLYTLLLESDKYYVGTTDNVWNRLISHSAGNGASWVTKYKIVNVISVTSNKTRLDEDMEVKRLMIQHGIDNVRGGTYSQIVLPVDVKKVLQREISHANGLCVICNQSGHFANSCPNKMKCERCGRNNHTIVDCYAKYKLNGQPL